MIIRRTLKYRLYTSKKNKHLYQMIDVAGIIWNQCVAAQRDAYKAGLGYISKYDLQKRVGQLRRHHPDCQHWQLVGSQAVQNIVERLDKSYQRFFAYQRDKKKRKVGRPTFKKVKQYKSITLKQAGWKLLDSNKIRIGNHIYKFCHSRPVTGVVKTVTIKRDKLNRLWVCFSVMEDVPTPPIEISTGHIGGFDFGLKAFLTNDEGKTYHSPLFFKQGQNEIVRLNRSLARKVKGSNGWRKARRQLANAHERIANQRKNWHWQLAHTLTDQYDFLCFETLNISAMQKMWGRKVSDLGFATFLPIVQYLAQKKGKRVEMIGRWEPTTKTCCRCGHQQHMPLHIRMFDCEACDNTLPRDQNAGMNIKAVGASAAGLGNVRRQIVAIPA